MNESLIKYLAGLLDADGSLSFGFKAYERNNEQFYISLNLSLASSKAVDHDGFVPSLPTVTGMGGAYWYGAEKQFVSWKVSKRSELEMLLPRVIKHMVIKGKHWQWLLETWRAERGSNLSPGRRFELTEASKLSRIERTGPVKPKNHPTWAWLSGYLDGDGWYRKWHQSTPGAWTSHVGAVSHENDMHVLWFLKNAFGGVISNHGQCKNVYIWRRSIGPRDASFALRFLPKVARHSRLKRHKIDQLIHAHRQRLSVPSPAGQATV